MTTKQNKMKNLVVALIASVAIVGVSCKKECPKPVESPKTYVKTTTSVFDDAVITIPLSEYASAVENTDAVIVSVYYKNPETNQWILIRDLTNVTAVVSISIDKTITIRLHGAPIDPAVDIKIVLK